ncbi:MAG: dihydrodipicolinate synthase family protein [Clostridia bacterium]|nr:dihydrodipicolinate synthase family protein [Clostridia bacterium]
MNKKLGVFPTMVTPYTKEGKVDYKGVEALVEWYWKKGCDGIFAVCQSSEIFFLTLEERVNIGKTVVEKAKALAEVDKTRKPMKVVVSGHVSDSFEDQVEELTAMSGIGADALILISNRMDIANTTDEKWIEDLHKLIAKIPTNMPLGVYECPKPYKRLLTKKMLEACKATGRFAFIKDTCCDAEMIKERIEVLKGCDIGLYNANAQTLLETLRAGADGYCGVMANFHPEIYKWPFDNADKKEAEIVQAFVCMTAFTESLAYPATAKYYVNAHEGIEIEPISRAVDCNLITEYQKSCLAQMKTLGDSIKKQIGIGE